jgi:hypothetical protein
MKQGTETGADSSETGASTDSQQHAQQENMLNSSQLKFNHEQLASSVFQWLIRISGNVTSRQPVTKL